MRIALLLFFTILTGSGSFSQIVKKKPGNPVFPGWHADPEGIIFGNKY